MCHPDRSRIPTAGRSCSRPSCRSSGLILSRARIMAHAIRRARVFVVKNRMRMHEESHDPSARAAEERYSATMRAPFAALGIRSDGNAITGVVYLPDRTPEQAPSDRTTARVLREIERY